MSYGKQAKEDLAHWEKSKPIIVKHIELLIEDIKNMPFKGAGKPDQLRFKYAGYWSRRIDLEHQLVYKIYEEKLYIVQCRYHY